MNSAFTDHVEVSEMPEGYGDTDSKPILPKTRIPFPAVFSDDSADGFGSPGKSRRRSSGTRREGRRIVSQETTTTTTTRKLERRKIRYSASILDEMSDSNLPLPMEPTKTSKSQPLLAHRSHSPGHASTSRSHSHSSSRPKHRSTASPRRSTSNIYPISPPPSSPTSPRVHSHSRRRKSSSISRPSRLSTNQLVLHSSSDSPSSPFDDPTTFANALGDTTLPLFRPFVNMFTFLLVSSFCCMTVSAVLVASFSLTFYDDCGRRLSGLNRSLRAGARSIEGGIGGVREGMGKMLGNARGAIDSAVKAAEGITTNGDEEGGHRENHHRDGSKRTAMPTVTEEDNEGDDERDHADEDEEQMGNSQRDKGKNGSRSRSRTRTAAGGAPRTQGWRFRPSPGPSNLRRSFNPFSSFSTPPSPIDPTPPSPHTEPPLSTSSEPKSGWATDEDALPYEVPHPTPYTSRPASPHRSPRSRQSSSSSSHSNNNNNEAPPLPPRPHLAVLLPSLFLAVFLTLAKLAYSFWKHSQEKREELRKRQERFEEEWKRRRREEDWRNRYNYTTAASTSYHN